MVNITNKEVGLATFVTFETNITDIDKIYTPMEEFQINEESFSCFFIKHDKVGPLYLSCAIQNAPGEYVIEKIEGFTKNDSHYKYNFIFETQTMHETIHISGSTSVYINNIFPETINFTAKDVSQLLLFTAGNINSIRLDKDGEDLVCNNIPYEIGSIKNCTISKEHFKNKDIGYYFIHYKNNANNYVTLYEYFGVNIIFPSSGNSGKILELSFGLLILLFLLI